VLLGCYGVPGRGGAATVGYRLHEVLSAAGVDVHYLTIVDAEDPAHHRYLLGEHYGNPLRLPNAETCVLTERLYGPHPELGRAIEAVGPDVMVGVGTISAVLMKRACPGLPLVLLTTGCQQMMRLIERGSAPDFLAAREMLARARGRPGVDPIQEREAVERADLTIAHAEVVRWLYQAFFPDYHGKIWPEVLSFGEWIVEDAAPYRHLARPFAERDVDALFVASAWARPEKNERLARRVVAALPGLRVHVVGEVESPWPGAVHHGFVADRAALFALLGRAKTVVSTSAFDAAPGVLFEASAMGCNVVASPNCGNAALCHPDLLVPRADAVGFVRAIRASLARKYEDHADAFLGAEPTRRLIEILQVV
jgi:glycosyltransferase involved in cell wall biosynthesis